MAKLWLTRTHRFLLISDCHTLSPFPQRLSHQGSTMAVAMSSCQLLAKNLASSLSAKSNQKTHFSSSVHVADSRHTLDGLTCKARKVFPPPRVAMQDSLSDVEDEFPFFPNTSSVEKKNYPAGLQRYESMVVLRPDLTEEERVSLTERYEELLVAGGALDVEMFNRGIQPLSYRIKTKNMVGALAQYEDGIYLLFTYVTKPESQAALQAKLNSDDDVIRSSTFRLKM